MTRLNPQGMPTSELLRLYNEHANELGEKTVTRFADREAAERRTIDIHDRMQLKRLLKRDIERRKQAVEAVKDPGPLLYNQEGLDRVQRRASEVLSTLKPPRWASPKEEKAGAKAYRPKAGTSQFLIYDLLTEPVGVDIETFCSEMNKTLKPGVAQWTPSNTWSGVRYLFCALRGYGLRFDGRRLRLLVPKNEVSTSLPKK